MGAVRANGEQFRSRAHQQHVIVGDTSEQRAAICKRVGGYPLRQIRARYFVRVTHGDLAQI